MRNLVSDVWINLIQAVSVMIPSESKRLKFKAIKNTVGVFHSFA